MHRTLKWPKDQEIGAYGKNGRSLCCGLETFNLYGVPKDAIKIQLCPINSKGKSTINCGIDIPVNNIGAVIEMLHQIRMELILANNQSLWISKS